MNGIQRSEHGHIVLGGCLTQLSTVVLTLGIQILGVDEVSDMALAQCLGNLAAASIIVISWEGFDPPMHPVPFISTHQEKL